MTSNEDEGDIRVSKEHVGEPTVTLESLKNTLDTMKAQTTTGISTPSTPASAPEALHVPSKWEAKDKRRHGVIFEAEVIYEGRFVHGHSIHSGCRRFTQIAIPRLLSRYRRIS